MFSEHLQDDDRAVSPVIGVILMVAITVILAAVIGTFVLGLGQQVSQTTPVSSIAVSDDSENFQGGDTDGTDDAFTIAHNGGDAIKSKNLKIVIRNADGSTVTSWSAGSPDSGYDLSLNGEDAGTGFTFSVGDTLTIEDTSLTSTSLSDKTSYTIQLIHTPSQGQVASSTVKLT